jgi:HAD superfamily hydrolase (TIGR01549 family)
VIELEEALIKDIIFDLDGTLIQSRENIYEINRIVFSNVLGREVSLGEAKDKFHSEFSKLFEAFEVTCSKKQSEAVSNWGKVAESFSYELFEGAKDILDWLKEKGITMHLWTARDENSARKILRHHDMESHFSTLSFATLKDSKPNPKSLGFDWKSLNKNEFLVIGDSPSDIKGARNIKAISCAALWDPHSNRDSLHSSGAEIFFHEMSDFRDWLSKVTKPKEIERYGSVRPQVGVASVVDTGLC